MLWAWRNRIHTEFWRENKGGGDNESVRKMKGKNKTVCYKLPFSINTQASWYLALESSKYVAELTTLLRGKFKFHSGRIRVADNPYLIER